tara:strand:- start:52 stop:249 length:198 start_codon:yes stop_codon:yes gene_type:complete
MGGIKIKDGFAPLEDWQIEDELERWRRFSEYVSAHNITLANRAFKYSISNSVKYNLYRGKKTFLK